VYPGIDVLADIGLRQYTLHRKAQDFIKYDNNAFDKLYKLRSDNGYIDNVHDEIELQEKLLKEDTLFLNSNLVNAWDSSVRSA
jgi:CPA2 family monovalent cation:H+ antiporter-2